MKNGKTIGISTWFGYSSNEGKMLTLAMLDNEHAQPGNEVTFVWGEQPGIVQADGREPRPSGDPRGRQPGALRGSGAHLVSAAASRALRSQVARLTTARVPDEAQEPVQPEIAKDGTVSPGASGTAGYCAQRDGPVLAGGTLMHHPPVNPPSTAPFWPARFAAAERTSSPLRQTILTRN